MLVAMDMEDNILKDFMVKVMAIILAKNKIVIITNIF